ncbi:MAG: hypothetical protein ABJB74_15820 [Gemmatimonas sp.]
MSGTDLRARSASELVDAAFALYRRDLMQYVLVTAVAYAPSTIARLLLNTLSATPDISDLWKFVPFVLLALFTFTMVGGVIARMGSDVYLGGVADVAGTIRAVLPRFGSLVGATFLTSMMAFFSLLFFLLPVFWVLAMTFAVFPLVVLEDRGPSAAIARSSALSKGLKGHILGTQLLVWGIYIALSLGMSALSGLTGSQTITVIIQALYAVFAYPIVNLVTMLLYYDARIRKEGFDVEHMAQTLSAPPMSSAMGGSVA